MNNWLNEIRLAMHRIKDLEERVEALESPLDITHVALLKDPVGMVAASKQLMADMEPVKRKPGRPRKNA